MTSRRRILLGVTCLVALLVLARGETPGEAATGRLGALEAKIRTLTRSVRAQWGIYVKCLETGEELAFDADRPMDTMSVIKIPIMVEAFRQAEEGRLDLDRRITIQARDQRPGTGVLRRISPGESLTLRDLIALMIEISDNTATDLVLAKVGGPDPVNRLMESWGLRSIRVTGYTQQWFQALAAAPSMERFHLDGRTPFGLSSPRDTGLLLERISRGQAVSPRASKQMLAILREQIFSSRLPRYVTGYELPHKTGDFMPFIGNDVGILESPRRHVVISVFTAGHTGSGPVLEEAIARIGESVAEYFAAP